VDLARGRGRGGGSWIFIVLPVVGLSIVPVFGLIHAATTSFGKGEGTDSSASAAANDDDDDEATGSPGAGATKRGARAARSRRSKSSRPRSDSASICCAKLRELGKTSAIEERSKYLSAATSCDNAPDVDTALRRVANSLRASGAEVPSECQSD